jgi:hypothetical protein
MLTAKRLITGLMFCAFLICSIDTASGQTGKQTETESDAAVLKTLLKEVRLLRLALERNNMIAHRSEVLVGRLQAQQERVDRLARELEETRKQMSESRYDPAQAAETLQEMEKKREAGVIDGGQVKEVKAHIAQQERAQLRLAEREGILARELEVERANLNELKIRLDALERLFDEVEEATRQLQKKR